MFNKKIKRVIKVSGMSCSHCANKVESALKNIKSVKKVSINLEKQIVTISSTEKINLDNVEKIVEDLGYKYIGVVED